jgi:metal-dependent amidase/aminoacylase/carboxypeptidase family protein
MRHRSWEALFVWHPINGLSRTEVHRRQHTMASDQTSSWSEKNTGGHNSSNPELKVNPVIFLFP